MQSRDTTTTPSSQQLREEFEDPFTCEEELACIHGILSRDDHRDSRHIFEIRKHNYKLIRATQLCIQQIEELEQGQTPTFGDLRAILKSTTPEIFAGIFVTPSLLRHKWRISEPENTPETDG